MVFSKTENARKNAVQSATEEEAQAPAISSPTTITPGCSRGEHCLPLLQIVEDDDAYN